MNTFAGSKLSVHLPESYLIKCNNCSLYFKWPKISKEQLDKFYQNGNPEHWQYELKNRKDWQIASDYITKNCLSGSILDVGCWDGSFLEKFRNDLHLYGIEINPFASDRASKKGIKLIAKNIDEIETVRNQFDIVTAFDVIEHVENPLKFLGLIASITKENGIIIVSSGDTDTFVWRITKGKNLYCANSEHIAFINAPFCIYAAKKLNLRIIQMQRFIHSGEFIGTKLILDSFKNIIYLTMPNILKSFRTIKYNYFCKKAKILDETFDYPPPWMWKHDHLIVVFIKEN